MCLAPKTPKAPKPPPAPEPPPAPPAPPPPPVTVQEVAPIVSGGQTSGTYKSGAAVAGGSRKRKGAAALRMPAGSSLQKITGKATGLNIPTK